MSFFFCQIKEWAVTSNNICKSAFKNEQSLSLSNTKPTIFYFKHNCIYYATKANPTTSEPKYTAAATEIKWKNRSRKWPFDFSTLTSTSRSRQNQAMESADRDWPKTKRKAPERGRRNNWTSKKSSSWSSGKELVSVQDACFMSPPMPHPSDIEADGQEASVFEHTYFLLCSIPVYIDISFHSKLQKCSIDMQ